jgi:hypothetical protein
MIIKIYIEKHLWDFIYSSYSSDDVYPIFEEMINSTLPTHYLTEKIDMYNRYCKKKSVYQ